MKKKITIIKAFVFFSIVLSFTVPSLAESSYSRRADVQQFIEQMIKKHKFDRALLTEWFSSTTRLDDVLEKIAKPAEKTHTWGQYRPIFVNKRRIELGKDFMRQYHELLSRAEKQTGVPATIIAAIIGVETYYGRLKGSTPVFDSLTTLGFDYPPRADFFKSELEQFLLLAREENIDAREIKGSYAGAMGVPQFISSSYREYAVDFDKDGKRDLWNNMADVIGSVANYFKVHGWQKDGDVVRKVKVTRRPENETRTELKPHTTIGEFRKQGVVSDKAYADDVMATLVTLDGDDGLEYWLGLKNFYVITRYNHSALYAMAVYQLSKELEKNS